MKRSHIFASLCISIAALATGCSNIPVDPITPIIDRPDSNIVSGKVTLSIDVLPQNVILMIGGSVQLTAMITVHRDPLSKDTNVKNFVLKDSSVTWSIVSGGGNITAKGFYSAPLTIAGMSETILVKARSNADVNTSALVTITVRKPNLMPLSLGSYWVYENYPLDTLTGLHIDAQMYVDSTVVMGTVLQGGMVTSMAISYKNGIPHDTVYYTTDNGEVWAYTKLNDNLSITPLDRIWIKVLDANSTQWIAYDSTLSNTAVIVNGQPGVLNGRITLVCARAGVDSIECAAGKFNAQKYIITYTVNVVISVNGINIPVQYSQPSTQWYADNVGMVRSLTDLFQVVNPFGGSLKRTSHEALLTKFELK